MLPDDVNIGMGHHWVTIGSLLGHRVICHRLSAGGSTSLCDTGGLVVAAGWLSASGNDLATSIPIDRRTGSQT